MVSRPRRWFVPLALVIAALSGARALEPDAQIPGAEARLGLGGGFWVGAWAELRLEARTSGAFQVRLGAEDGSLRAGLIPFEARLELPDTPGVRVARLTVPLFSRRPVNLTLDGPTGSKTVRIEPYPGTPAVRPVTHVMSGSAWLGERLLDLSPSDVRPDPALWLSAPDLVLSERLDDRSGAALALAWLAAGGRVIGANLPGSLERVPDGPIGLGRLSRSTPQPRQSHMPLESVLRAALPEPTVPGMYQSALGWWCVGLFAACLGVFSARRSIARLTLQVAIVGALVGLIGAWAFSPVALETEQRVPVRIGAGGWGLETEIVSLVSLRQRDLELPPGALPLERVPRTYEATSTRLTQRGWSRIAYWTPPHATSLPLRVVNGRLENRAGVGLERLFVVGLGQQEPLGPRAARKLRRTSEFPPAVLSDLVAALPQGTALAYTTSSPKTLMIALPEDAP
jgi:hypothetical protein